MLRAMKALSGSLALVFMLSLIATVPARAKRGSPEPAETFVAPPDKALLIFVRPRFLVKYAPVLLLNEQRECIAATKGKTYTRLLVDPGTFSVFASALKKEGRWVDLHVDAGRTYVIRTRPSGYNAGKLTVVLAKRGEATFEQSKEWIAASQDYEADLEKMSRKLSKKRRQKRLEKALAQEAERRAASAAYIERHTVRPDDGRDASEAMELASP